ncbi:MAG TPA: cytochrome c oxidase subunit I [Verrucomicrobiae bacterium]|jgi:cytochrome c oxidase subunit 1/cytochrome c oxidase subunit I+III
MNATAAVGHPVEAALADQPARGLYGWIATVDHKRIGILYLLTTLVFFVLGGGEALLMRIQLARPNNTFLSPDAFDQMFTMHGTTMIFLVVMPTLIGLANYLVPLMIGARDMAFPRLNALSFWLLPCGGLLLHFSLLAGGAPAVGWFSYAPLSETPYASTQGVDYWTLSLLVLGIGSVAASINLIATILTQRAPGLTIRRLPLFVWMIFVNSFLVILALPALNAAIVMLFIDRHLGTHFFAPANGGSAVLWQHFFWAFGHPEVYIMALPAFGIISEVVPVFARRPIFGYEFVAGSTVAIALLSFGVWAHHMFAVGLGHPMDLFFAATSMMIAVPTGIKVFAWSATLWGGAIRLTTAMLFAVAFLIQFTIGGLSGITFAVVPIDWQVTGTYYLVAHFHYVLFGGTFFAIFAGIYYWFPKITGRRLSERLGKLNFWMALIGFNTAFFVQHFLGLMGMARRIYTYPNLPGWGLLNLISTIGAFLLGASVLVLLWNILVSRRRGQPAGDNPWQAWTLEWATTSPPPSHNFDCLPPIRSRRPLWDWAHPENPDPVVGGASARDGFALEKNRVGIATFLISEGCFFVMLILAYLYYNNQVMPGPQPGNTLNPQRTGIYTLCLLASSLTFWLAEKKLRSRNDSAFQWLLTLTIVLGSVFIFGQGREYLHLYHAGTLVNSNLFATTFFTLTGFHGLHVCVGLIGLLIILGLARAGDFKNGRSAAVKSIGLYWHFVDAVWLVVFSVVYLRLLL